MAQPDVQELSVSEDQYRTPCEALQKIMVVPLLRALTEVVLAMQAAIRPE